MSCPDVHELCVNEASQREYTATLRDKPIAPATVGDPVPLASLTALTITLKDVETGGVINTRTAQSVKNANNGTYHATSGLFTMAFQALDNIIVDPLIRTEIHLATFLATWSGGQHQWDVVVKVKNLGMTK